MNVIVALYAALLFFILVPNIIVRLPPNGDKFTVAAFHAIVFGIILYLTQHAVWRWSTTLAM